MTRKIAIFDTTLRDGEQSPGASMNTEEKLIIARQLVRMNVDVSRPVSPFPARAILSRFTKSERLPVTPAPYAV